MAKTNGKLELTKLALKTADGTKVELTIEEARELHVQLEGLFGNKEKTVFIPSPAPAPIIIECDHWSWRRPYWSEPVWIAGGSKVTWESKSGMQLTATCKAFLAAPEGEGDEGKEV